MISTLLNRHAFLTFVTALALFFVPVVGKAQDSLVLSVSPTLFEMTANQQQTWSSNVRVINANPFPITVYAEPVNFEPTGEAGQGTLIPVFSEETAGETLAEWIDVTDEEIVIEPEQTVSVPFTISVPENAPPGGHFAAILIGTRSFDDTPGQAQVETSQVVTSLVFLRVAGDIVEAGSVREFITERAVTETADATFSIRFENTGNVHIQPQGEIEIKNMWGQPRGTIPINQNSQFGNVLPESFRTYTYHWSSEWSLPDVGRHTAEVTLGYGEETRQTVTASTHFWLIPWKLLLAVLVFVTAFVALIVWSIKLYVRRMLQLAGVTPELQRQPAASKRVSIMAPVEAGILDLRSEFEHGTGSWFARLWSFIRVYKVFALLAGALAIFIGLLLWYVVLLITSDFAYEVQYEDVDGTTVDITTSEGGEAVTAAADAVQLVVINHSGQADALAMVESKLLDSPYQVVEAFETFDGAKERSVLVYDPSYLDQVTELQTLLPGVLVSSYVSPETDDPPIILYVGQDLLAE